MQTCILTETLVATSDGDSVVTGKVPGLGALAVASGEGDGALSGSAVRGQAEARADELDAVVVALGDGLQNDGKSETRRSVRLENGGRRRREGTNRGEKGKRESVPIAGSRPSRRKRQG